MGNHRDLDNILSLFSGLLRDVICERQSPRNFLPNRGVQIQARVARNNLRNAEDKKRGREREKDRERGKEPDF